MYLSFRTEKWYNRTKIGRRGDMKVTEIFTRKTKTASVTGATVPEERFFCGCFEIIGFEPGTNMVFVVDHSQHYFVNGIPYAVAWDAKEWLFRTENDEIIDFITED